VDLSGQLHAMAGLGAVALGIAVLVRSPGRFGNRLFALLCAALAVWNLGVAMAFSGLAPRFPWRLVFLLGGCAAAPLSIHFAVVVGDVPGRSRRLLLGPAYGAAAFLWISAWPSRVETRGWNLAALFVLGVLLVSALAILASHVVRLPPGRERRTLRLVVAAGVLAVAGGLSDFLPRGATAFPSVGPIFVLVFLLIVSAVVVRHRFLDVDVFLARAVALITGAAVVALVFLTVTSLFGNRFPTLILTSLAVLAAAGPLGRLLLTRTRELLRGEDAMVETLLGASRRLSVAREAEQVWGAIDEGRHSLPAGVKLSIWLQRSEGEPFEATYPVGSPGRPVGIPVDGALPVLLEEDRSPLTRRLLHIASRDSREKRRELAREALERMDAADCEVVVPLFAEDRLLGWLSLGGGEPETYLRAEVAAALQAVGQQAVASLGRIRATDEARRREALAAVGEMAAGLAHEVRNPVAAIRGAAQAIVPGASGEQSAEMLEVIQEETARLGNFVGEFLDYARPASPRREPVDLADTAARVARDAGLAGLDLRIELEVEDGVPRTPGDPEQIRRAFENLVRNAGEATGAGGTLKIRIAAVGTRVIARFEDDGPGIEEARIETLFQPFQTSRPGGTGLGLALVHRIVEAHQGEIRVDGRPGSGAIFTLSFPIAAAVDSAG
jgi:signal transduction histidine kinase